MGQIIDNFTSNKVDALASWKIGPAKAAIMEFVASVTRLDGPHYVSPEERIAVFDNDGTLWSERPVQTQVYFALKRIEELAAKDPSLAALPACKALIGRDVKALSTMDKHDVFAPALAAHAGMSPREFEQLAQDWLTDAKHPTLGRLFRECVYLPQLELLRYLRANGFSRYIVTGGGVDFVRAFAEDVYGVPASQVIGSSVKTHLEEREGREVLIKLPELNSFNDGEVKVENIQLHVGRRPILAFGNSDGDLPMLQYTLSGKGPRLGLLLHHDDKQREFAYDREFKLSPLAKALDNAKQYGITVVSMKRDWKGVFRHHLESAHQAA